MLRRLPLLLVACWPAAQPKLQTGPADPCTKNEDCYCRMFTGAQFLEGRRSSSRCCLEAGCKGEANGTVPNHCVVCIYE